MAFYKHKQKRVEKTYSFETLKNQKILLLPNTGNKRQEFLSLSCGQCQIEVVVLQVCSFKVATTK